MCVVEDRLRAVEATMYTVLMMDWQSLGHWCCCDDVLCVVTSRLLVDAIAYTYHCCRITVRKASLFRVLE
jgi:hypothetical protein